MSDLRTHCIVNYDGRYRVAIQEDGDRYQAAVVKTYLKLGRIVGAALGEDDPEWSDVEAPIVSGSTEFEAVGKAIDAWLDDDEECNESGEI